MDELVALKRSGGRDDLLTARRKALSRIGIKDIDPPSLQVNKILLKAFDGGFAEVMEDIVPFIAEYSNEYEVLGAIWEKASPSDKGTLRPEDFLYAAGIPVRAFLGEITSATFDRGANIAAMIAAAKTPEIIKAAIRAATSAKGGTTDRMMLLQMTKMLPQPKGAEVNVHFGSN
ncbi:MAG: hypothetical protein ACXABY_09445, partial [Candidatus Thorarchaeota archaeon]